MSQERVPDTHCAPCFQAFKNKLSCAMTPPWNPYLGGKDKYDAEAIRLTEIEREKMFQCQHLGPPPKPINENERSG